MISIDVRPARPADGTTIARIQLAAWRATYGHLNPAMVGNLDLDRTAANWSRSADDPARRLRIADLDGEAIGYALSGPAEGEGESVGELDAVYLLPAAHGKGAGRLLVDDALTGLAAAGHRTCILWVAEQNAHARAFYAHLGFRPDGGVDTWRDLPVLRYRRPTSPEPHG